MKKAEKAEKNLEFCKRLNDICVFIFVLAVDPGQMDTKYRQVIDVLRDEVDSQKLLMITTGQHVDDDTMFTALKYFSLLKNMDGILEYVYNSPLLKKRLDHFHVDVSLLLKFNE